MARGRNIGKKGLVFKETVLLRRWGNSPQKRSWVDFSIRSDEGLTLETSAFRISVRWPIYIINSVDKTKFLYTKYRGLVISLETRTKPLYFETARHFQRKSLGAG